MTTSGEGSDRLSGDGAPSPRKHLDNPTWLRGVRDDLDSNADEWFVRQPANTGSKLQAIGQYLDTILAELGYPAQPHKCPTCGHEHRA